MRLMRNYPGQAGYEGHEGYVGYVGYVGYARILYAFKVLTLVAVCHVSDIYGFFTA